MKMAVEDVHYSIFPVDPGAHLFEVSVWVAKPDPSGQRLSLPVWIPGSYLVREFARHLDSVSARACRRPPKAFHGESAGAQASVAARSTKRPAARVSASDDAGSMAIGIRKIDKNTWLCDALPDAGLGLMVRYQVYAWDLSVRAAHLDTTHGFFNGSSVFLCVEGQEDRPCSVDILPPNGEAFAHWKVATTLPRPDLSAGGSRSAKGSADALYQFGRFRAPDYDALIDHPVEMGDFQLAHFDAGGCRHEIVVTGRASVDFERLIRDLKPICETEIAMFDPVSRKAPVQRYLFLVMAVGDGYGGLEHRASTALICSRDDLPWPGMRGTPSGYQTFLGLASHEYFHTWHVKRIKPARFAPYDLDREVYTELLWVFEGFTSYYDDLTLVRSGAIDEAAYLKLLAQAMQRVASNPGRRLQSVAESSFDAWIKYYRPDENTQNAVSSYYVKGSLVALCLDLLIRERTQGQRSLDDVMRLLWQRYGQGFYDTDTQRTGSGTRRPAGVKGSAGRSRSLATKTAAHASHCTVEETVSPRTALDVVEEGTTGRGVGEADMPALIQEATGLDLRRQIRAWAYGTEELPLARLLKPMGLAVVTERPEDVRVSLGMRTGMRDGELTILTAERDGPAAAAGLSAGDLLVAVDGLRCTEARLKTLLARKAPGETVLVAAFRRDELLMATVELVEAPGTIRLEAQPGAHAMRAVWLGTVQKRGGNKDRARPSRRTSRTVRGKTRVKTKK
ncbi:PDZ domain-containing protein [Lautropia mirabilis]